VSTIVLSNWDIALAALLILLNAGLSLVLQLGLARTLLVAAVRAVLQLALLAVVLQVLFETNAPWMTAGVALVMILFAGREASARQKRRLSGFWGYGIGAASMFVASFSVTLYALTVAVRPSPWYSAQYAIPLLGMILGNCMTGVALGLNVLLDGAARERNGIEAMLALGHTRWEALRPLVKESVRNGLIPIVNSMAATGVVFIPGMMTGQILAGADPSQAARYQLLILFMIAGGTALGATVAVFGGAFRITDERHRLRLDRLSPAGVSRDA